MNFSVAKLLELVSALLLKRPLLPLAILLVLGVGVITWHWSYASKRLVETLSLRNASLYTKALVEFRTLYTSEVVATDQ